MIDFVIPWVDGSDPAWQKERDAKAAQLGSMERCDNRGERYRDWDNLKYWFRGVEKFAPWVHKIYFVTWGHLPEWLDVQHPKLVIVRHEDYSKGISANVQFAYDRVESASDSWIIGEFCLF